MDKSLKGKTAHFRTVLAEEIGHYFTAAGEAIPRPYFHHIDRVAVLDDIENIFQGNMEELADAFMKQYGKQSENMLAEMANVRKLSAETSRKMDNLFAAIENGTLDSAIAGARLNTINKEKLMLEKRLAALEEVQEFPFTRDQVLEYLNTSQHVLADRDNPMMCKRLVDIFIQQIVITKDDVKIIKRLPLNRMVDADVAKMVDHQVLIHLTTCILRKDLAPTKKAGHKSSAH